MESFNAKRFYTLGFSLLPNIGPARFKKIISVFEHPEAAWKAQALEYEARGLPLDIVKIISEHREAIDINAEWNKMEKHRIAYIDQDSPEYPRLLREIHHPPIGLFVRGTVPQDAVTVAIVGTRKMTHYGLGVTKNIAAELASMGVVVVSGLAIGVDTAAHASCIQAGGKTIAVVGGGLDDPTLYPPANRKLATEIADHAGAVISEYGIGVPSLMHHFPVRNRIIAGLSRATVVIEADLQSGALITSKFALEENREIFAVPGNITNPYAAGPNALIKQGAHPLLSAEDILTVLDMPRAEAAHKAKKIFPSSPDEKALFALLGDEPTHVDDITRASGLDTKLVNSTLTLMEMKGIVRHIGAGLYTKESL